MARDAAFGKGRQARWRKPVPADRARPRRATAGPAGCWRPRGSRGGLRDEDEAAAAAGVLVVRAAR